MKPYFILILCLFIISCSSDGNDSMRIDLNAIYDHPNRGFLVLYPVTELEDSLLRKIDFPNLSEVPDTAFAQIYFTGINHSAIENGVLVLIGNYSSESPLLWVDYNNDLKFSNSNVPLLFSKEFIDISIPDIDEPDIAHTIRFHKPDSAQKVQTKKIIEQYITKGKPYTDFYYDQRKNIKVGDFVYQQDSIRIGIMDFNVNGRYNDLGSDRIVIGEYGGTIYGTDEASGAVVLDSTTYFHGTNYGFEVIDVPVDGNTILIRPALTNNIERGITEGQSVPNYTFKLLSGEEISIHDFLDGQKYLYLNFWANWCAGCHQEIDDLERIQTSYTC